MQDNLLLYIDFINTLKNISQILECMIKNEMLKNGINDITAEQLILLYQLSLDPYHIIKEKQCDKKKFYYTLQKLTKHNYIHANVKDKHIISLSILEKGTNCIELFNNLFETQFKQLLFHGLNVTELSHILTIIYRFEKFWNKILNKKQNLNLD